MPGWLAGAVHRDSAASHSALSAERAALVGSQLLGLAVARYVLAVPPLVGMDDAQLTEWLRPVPAHYLAGPAPRPG